MPWIINKKIKIYLLAIGFVGLLTIFLTILAMSLRDSRRKLTMDNIVEQQIDISRFIIPESYTKFRDGKWKPFRLDRDSWTSMETEPYWQDSKKLILEYLEVQNEKLINELFQDIP